MQRCWSEKCFMVWLNVLRSVIATCCTSGAGEAEAARAFPLALALAEGWVSFNLFEFPLALGSSRGSRLPGGMSGGGGGRNAGDLF